MVYCGLSVLWSARTLTWVGNGPEIVRPDAQFGSVDVGQECTSASIFSFQFWSQKAITEDESHDFPPCATD